MGSFSEVEVLVRRADSARLNSDWTKARILYGQVLDRVPEHPGLMHNMALCAYALGDFAAALKLTQSVLSKQPGFWQSEVIYVQALRRSGDLAGAWAYLRRRVSDNDAPVLLKAELANLALNEFGAPLYARSLMAECAKDPEYQEDAELTALMASLYDRDGQSAEEVVANIKHFAKTRMLPDPGADKDISTGRHHVGQALSPAEAALPESTKRKQGDRSRIGLLSPFFNSSPVYFFGFGALRLLAESSDLIFFNRGNRSDWASNSFRGIANTWIDCAHVPSAALERLIKAQGLDVLVDMGGWSDVTALRAIAGKPVRRMYKWVGGQSATTGLDVFDGWITDRHQSLPEHQAHHTEPLVFIEGGYVTYTPPIYLPEPAPAPVDKLLLGVVTNPAKLSNSFLAELPQYLEQAQGTRLPFRLQFIDRRFAHADVRARVLTAIDPAWHDRAEFIAPTSHLEYLLAIGRLSAVLDTFPYSGGLTAMEAIALGVPINTQPGTLFSERHAWSHLAYSGVEIRKMHVVDLPALAGLPRAELAGTADRFNHRQLADSLATLFSEKSVVTRVHQTRKPKPKRTEQVSSS